jgi:hypothetical protein
MPISRHLLAMASAALLCGVSGPAAGAQRRGVPAAPGEVRQLVTFLFQPGRSTDAFTIYEQQLKPIYESVPALRRFRAYREAESPEPLDLVVISSYDGMAGMDAANEALRRPPASGPGAFALYGQLSGMTQTHHDQFIEMVPAFSDAATSPAPLIVFEYLRIAPGKRAMFAHLMLNAVRPFETRNRLYRWSEYGRVLVGDGWDVVRIFGVRNLGDWHSYHLRMRTMPQGSDWDATIAARKTIIMRQDDRLSVR